MNNDIKAVEPVVNAVNVQEALGLIDVTFEQVEKAYKIINSRGKEFNLMSATLLIADELLTHDQWLVMNSPYRKAQMAEYETDELSDEAYLESLYS
jgi:hypothetical protein